jgi:hypothetical protein
MTNHNAVIMPGRGDGGQYPGRDWA